MTKNKSKSQKDTMRDNISISIAGNSNAVAAGSGAHASIQQDAGGAGMDAWRKQMEKQISVLKNLPNEDKSTLTQQVAQIAAEASKGPAADPGRVERLLNTLAVMAPDILDVAVTTLINPLAGVGLVVKKVGEKAKVQKA